MRCPRKHNLMKQNEKLPINQVSGMLATGVYFHGFMDLGLSGPMGIKPEDVDFIDNGVDVSYSVERYRAEALFRDWVVEWSEIFGSVFRCLGTEVTMPQTEEQKEILNNLLSGLDRTMTWDAVLWVPEATPIISNSTYLMLEPGVYLLDHKTHEQNDSLRLDRYNTSHQFSWYSRAFQALFPDLEYRGMIVNSIIATKTPKFELYLVPPPTEQHFESTLRQMYTAEYMRKDVFLNDWPDTNSCFDFHNICQFHYSIGGPCTGG